MKDRLETSTVSAEGDESPELRRKGCMPTTLGMVVAGKKSGMRHMQFDLHGAVFSIYMRSWSKTAPLGSFTSDEDQHPVTNISSCAYSGCKNTSLGNVISRKSKITIHDRKTAAESCSHLFIAENNALAISAVGIDPGHCSKS
ncbi:conserved hypothetical protein [Trichinella spiralis]|uniref:hypothetical protein n=1 Tax=Trichinella spiralis TaxID=6334 RepID=UPI0001EFC3C9|nr:conserved hypothetical protein [Trichinella spiralis]